MGPAVVRRRTDASLAGNSLGLFIIGVPATGLASGAFAAFLGNGGAFYGSIVGIVDPEKLKLSALAQAQQNATLTDNFNGKLEVITIPQALATGQIRAKLKQSGNISGSGFRVKGTATLSVFTLPGGAFAGAPVFQESVSMTVDGFQQSTTVSGLVDISTLTGTIASPTTAGS